MCEYLIDKYLTMSKLGFELGFEQHDELNPLLWDGVSLRPEVRQALLKIAQDFRSYVGLDFPLVDVVLTGSQASYWYTGYSDLDLHLIVNYSELSCDRELDELFDTKRHLYNRDHNITIRRIPVELYVENLAEPAHGAAYSLSLNRWIRAPQQQRTTITVDEQEILRMTELWAKIIDRAIQSKDLKIQEKTQKLLKKYRVLGLKKTGEFGVANLVYKTLRNSKRLEKLSAAIDHAQDQKLSLR